MDNNYINDPSYLATVKELREWHPYAVEFGSQESINLYRTMLDRALNGKDLRPKDRSIAYDQFARIAGHAHPTREKFVVYGYYDDKQAMEHGTRVWVNANGEEHELSHVSYKQVGPDRYPQASFAGRFVRFVRNAIPSVQFQQRQAERMRVRANARNLVQLEAQARALEKAMEAGRVDHGR